MQISAQKTKATPSFQTNEIYEGLVLNIRQDLQKRKYLRQKRTI